MPKTKPTLPPSCGLFSSRDTLEEALAYANDLILSGVPVGAPRQAALTALHVTSNTAIKLLEGYQIRKPEAEIKGKDMTIGEHMFLLREAAPAIGKLSFLLKNVYPEAADVLGLVMAAIMVMTDLSLDEVVNTIQSKGVH